jgi:hypothetical protein
LNFQSPINPEYTSSFRAFSLSPSLSLLSFSPLTRTPAPFVPGAGALNCARLALDEVLSKVVARWMLAASEPADKLILAKLIGGD